VLTAKTQYNLANAREYFEEHLCVGDYYDEGQRVPDPVFRTVAWCRVWDIPAVKRFSIPAVEPGI